jgi:hypothetical protein
MFVRTVLWDLDGSKTTIEELRTYLGSESVDAFSSVEGLRLKLWIADEDANRWGAIYLWESRAAARQKLPSKARELIGKDPDEVREFDLEASVEGRYEVEQLTRRGRAF